MLKIFRKYLNFENISKKCIRVREPIGKIYDKTTLKFIIIHVNDYKMLINIIETCDNTILPSHGNVEHEYIFSKYYWNLIKNNILPIFRREAWNYLNNCLHICVFMYVCFWKQKKILSFNRFSLILLKNFDFQIKRVWFERWNFKFRLTLENEVFYISETL